MKKILVMGLMVLGLMVSKELWAETYVSGTISSNAVWTQTGSPYIVTDTVTVTQGVVLTIEPGATIRFATETSLICYGTLNAVGTPDGTITFTSNQVTHTAGHWNGIKLSGSGANGSQISYCDIGYAKQAIYLENVSGIVITHSYIHDNKGDDGSPEQLGEIGCGIYLSRSNNNFIGTNIISNNTGGQGGGGGDMYRVGGDGGIGAGICLWQSSINIILGNTISQNIGGVGGSGYINSGASGGMGCGVYLSSSTDNTISGNTISQNIGGVGGMGGYCSQGGLGGMGCGVYLSSSTDNAISGNTISQNTGGVGGTSYQWGGNGQNGNGYGIYIEQDSLNNTLSQTNTYNGESIHYYYEVTTATTIENQNLTLAGAGSTNLGRIVLINCQNFTIKGNLILGGIGQAGKTGGRWCNGGPGGIGCGVYLSSSTNIIILGNTISQNIGGAGGSLGGYGGLGGAPGQGYGVYSCSNSFPSIHYNSLSGNKKGDNTKGYGVYHDGSSGTISATSNWWGDNSGPYHSSSNPLGVGDQVSDWVDYRPLWTGITSLSPQKGHMGTLVTIEGIGFATQTQISIFFGTHPTITTTQSSINGTFSVTFKVSAQTPGTKVITAQDTSGNLAITTFLLMLSNISVSPSSALVGREVTVCGSSFFENSLVTISFGTHLTITTAQTNPNGTFSATFIVDTQTPGTKVITAIDTEGNLATTLFILLPPTFLKIVPSYKIIAKNQEFDVEVRIEDVRNLAAVQAYLSFNPNVLEVIQLSSGSFPSGAFVSTNTTSGSIYYFAGLFSGSATGSGVLCQIRFRGKEGGSSTLTFNSNTALRDAGNNPIPFNKCEGLYYVASSLSVSPENRTILSGNSQSYSAFAICETGSVNVTGSATFSASGGGSFTTNLFEAHYIGTYTIQAVFLGLIGTTNVYITPGTPTSLLYVSGNNQTSTCTETLANPFIVKVEDAYHNPCPDVTVNFAVISYPTGAVGYSLSTTTTRTNINGTTSSHLTLGDEPPGSYTIRVSSGSLSSFDFTAWSLRRFGNIAGICLIDYGTEGQRTASITVTLIETQATTTTNSNSYFIFNNIPVGTYTLAFTYPGATPATRTAVITQTQFNDTTNIGTITLIAGDPNGDGQINMLDWPYLADSLGSELGSPNYNPACDFNSDGKIDIDDFMIFRLNFGEQQQGGRGGRALGFKRSDRAITLRFEPNSIDDAKIGNIITMNILISGAKNSLGGEIHLTFNPEVLEAIAVNKGDWIQQPWELCNKIDNNLGKIDLALGALKPITESSGLFAKVSFRVRAEGESLVRFEFDTEENRQTLFIEKDQTPPEIIPDEGKIEVIPLLSILLQSYPNPSSDSCFIPFKLSEDAEVIVEVYNITGQRVRTIEAGWKKAGLYIKQDKALFYDTRNDRGDKLSQGLYFIKLKAGKYSGRQRLVIQR